MEADNKKRNRRNDIILIIIIFAVAIVFGMVQQFGTKEGASVVIMLDGEVMQKVSLMEDLSGENALRIETAEGYNILEIKNGKASVTDADCPDGLCVKQKSISKQGESLICLPHKLVITVEGAEESDIDAFAY